MRNPKPWQFVSFWNVIAGRCENAMKTTGQPQVHVVCYVFRYKEMETWYVYMWIRTYGPI